mmetsp:Transcript_5054/g.11626  ORF Transcript_5054/g.11626 Transcript_5054/m.11626 type:complete len:232 (-) Transcript_5054:60-755(-)
MVALCALVMVSSQAPCVSISRTAIFRPSLSGNTKGVLQSQIPCVHLSLPGRQAKPLPDSSILEPSWILSRFPCRTQSGGLMFFRSSSPKRQVSGGGLLGGAGGAAGSPARRASCRASSNSSALAVSAALTFRYRAKRSRRKLFPVLYVPITAMTDTRLAPESSMRVQICCRFSVRISTSDDSGFSSRIFSGVFCNPAIAHPTCSTRAGRPVLGSWQRPAAHGARGDSARAR